MNNERLLLDTAFVQAYFDNRDQYHPKAVELMPLLRTATEVWITEAVIVEIGNALSSINRAEVVRFIDRCYHTQNIKTVNISTTLLGEAVKLYDARADKGWGLTDCISFIVMREQGLVNAMTSDKHFVQAGFQALLLQDN